MENKESYTPEEVAEIARGYDGLMKTLRKSLNAGRETMSEIIQEARRYQKNIPTNVGDMLDLERKISETE